MREDLAFEKASAGEMYLWQDVRLTTCLPFLRERDPVIRALVDILKDLWNLRAVPKKPRSRPNRRNAAVGLQKVEGELTRP